MSQPLPRLRSLTVLNGPLAGTCLQLEDVVDEIFIGSDPGSRLFLDVPGVSPIHARIWMDLGGASVRDTHSPRGLYLNDDRVVGDAVLNDGDVLWLGPPGEDQSVMIQCRFGAHPEPAVVVLPAVEDDASAEEALSEGLSEAEGPAPEGVEPSGEAALPAAEKTGKPSVKPAPGSGAEAPDEDLEIAPPDLGAVTVGEESLVEVEPSVDTDIGFDEIAPGEVQAWMSEALEPREGGAGVTSSPPLVKPSTEPTWIDQALVEVGAGPRAVDETEFFIEDVDVGGAEGQAGGAVPGSGFEEETPAPREGQGAMEDLLEPADPSSVRPEGPAAGTPSVSAATPEPWGSSVEEVFSLEGESAPDRGSSGFDEAFFIEEPAPPSLPEPSPPPGEDRSLWRDELFVSGGGLEEGFGSPAPRSSPEPAAEPAPRTMGAPEPAEVAAPESRLPGFAAASPATTEPHEFPAPEPELTGVSGRSAPLPREIVPPLAPSASASASSGPAPRTGRMPVATVPPAVADASRTARLARASNTLVRGAVLALLGLLIAGGAALFLARRFAGAPVLEAATPARLRVGDTLTLTGRNFSSAPEANAVLFGEKPGRVRQASPTRLEVEVPEVAPSAGGDAKVPVAVRTGGKESSPVTVAVYKAPRVQRLSAEVAMPGEEVAVVGTGWGPGASVRFGAQNAEVLEATSTALRVRVPALDGPPGTEWPLVVKMGASESGPASFYLGHSPLVTSVQPQVIAPGDLVTVSGRGFHAQAASNTLQIGPARALVVSATPRELKAVVPRLALAGELPLQLRVPASPHVGQAILVVKAAPATVDFWFVAEPFVDLPGHDHALLSTGIGPTFVLSASGGRSAATRALEAQKRLNEAGGVLRARADQDLEARSLDRAPALALVGQPGSLIEVTAEDAAAYNEDWTKTGGRGGPVTPGRMAVWWEAVARDLVLLLVRNEPPRHSAALASEGRILADLHRLGRRSGKPGFPQELAAELRPAVRDALRLVALRVPAAVVQPVSAIAASSPTAQKPQGFKLEGVWTGIEVEKGIRRYVTAQFRPSGGSMTYEGGLTLTVPLLDLEQPQRGAVRFSLQIRGGTRYYDGRWDGQRLAGKISSSGQGKGDLGTFELTPGR